MTSQELFDYLSAQLRDPAVPKPLRDLHDLSGVERFEVTPNAMRRAVAGSLRHSEHIQEARLAVIAPRDEIYGMFRLFQQQAEHAPVIEELRAQGLAPTVAVFRDGARARDWLLEGTADGSAGPSARRD